METNTYSFTGDFTESEIKYVEECSKFLPKRRKPYIFEKKYGRIMRKVD